MNFLQPQYLWAFAGLMVPVAIHLLSRKEGRVIRIGSIRHIRETPTRQFRSIRLNEYLLLLLRCLLLGVMVLFLSGWYKDGLKATHQWVVIEPGLESRPGLKALIDSLSLAGYERRFLTRGFPGDRVPGDSTEAPDYYALLEDLHRRGVESVVIASNRSSGFSGPRVALPENVKWIEVAPETHEGVIRLVQLRRDSVWERRGSFSGASTSFSTSRGVAGKGINAPDTVQIIVAYDKEFETDREIVMASLQAIKPEVPEIIKVQSVLAGSYSDGKPSWLIWLSTSERPTGATSTVCYTERPLARIIERTAKGTYLLTTRLNSEVAINRNFALHLMKIIVPDEEASSRARQYDRRVVSVQAAFGGNRIQDSYQTIREADQTSMRYLAIALLILVGLERLVAYQRKQ